MPTYVGGIRHRLIHDSVHNMIRDSLEALGWFDAGRAHQPINFIAELITEQDEIPLNTVSVSAAGISTSDIEMGSNYEEETTTYYADVYAENESLGTHLAGDIRDILRGKLPTIGRTGPVCNILDLTQDDPPVIFTVQIDDVRLDRATAFNKAWQRNWFAVRFDIVDSYGDELD